MEHCLVKTRLELKLICGDAHKLYKNVRKNGLI